MELAAAIFWAATTLYIKKVVEKRPFTHYQTLFAQLFFSIPVLGAASLLFERGQKKLYERIAMARFNLEWLTQGQDWQKFFKD